MTEIINQVFSIQEKTIKAEITLLQRNLDRILYEFEQMGYQVINPKGNTYKNEMTDVEAKIAGDLRKDSKITKVLKPIIYKKNDNGALQLIQKGIVIVD